MNKTNRYSYFCIASNGILENISENIIRFSANENSDFNPDEITRKLGIQPFKTRKMCEERKNGHGIYTFSSWDACIQKVPALDAEEQCIKIVRMLRDKIPVLNEIKRQIDVGYYINIVPHIYNEEAPAIQMNREIIEFCYLTGTEIGVDIYVYDRED